jgi:hypothetical protein
LVVILSQKYMNTYRDEIGQFFKVGSHVPLFLTNKIVVTNDVFNLASNRYE